MCDDFINSTQILDRFELFSIVTTKNVITSFPIYSPANASLYFYLKAFVYHKLMFSVSGISNFNTKHN